MAADFLSSDLKKFIAENINSVEQLEVLLLLHARPHQLWMVEAVARELRIDGQSAAVRLADLQNRGLLSAEGEPRSYRFAPASAQLAAIVPELQRAYSERRVTVISLIFSKPVDRVRTFADAFRLRDEKEE